MSAKRDWWGNESKKVRITIKEKGWRKEKDRRRKVKRKIKTWRAITCRIIKKKWRKMKVGWGKERIAEEVRRIEKITRIKGLRRKKKIGRPKVIRVRIKMKKWWAKERTREY